MSKIYFKTEQNTIILDCEELNSKIYNINGDFIKEINYPTSEKRDIDIAWLRSHKFITEIFDINEVMVRLI